MAKRRPIPWVVLVVFTSISLASGQGRPWTEARSPHFIVVADGGDKTARQIAWQFEQVRSALAAFWPWARLDLDRPVYVLSTSSESGMKALAPEYWERRGNVRPDSIAVTGADRHYIALRGDHNADDQGGQMNPYVNAYWSYTALIVQANADGELPLWLLRGLATLMSNTIVRDSYIDIGRPLPDNFQRLKDGQRLPLRELTGIGRDSPWYTNGDRLEVFDAQSWAFVHYLMFADNGAHRSQLGRFTGLLNEGRAQTAAIEQAFGGFDALEAGFRIYFNGLIFQYARANVDTRVLKDQFAARALTPSETAAARGAFHVAMRRPMDARTAMDEARKLDAAAAGSYEVEGLLAESDRKTDEARAAFGKASELGSTSFYPHLRWAALTMGRQDVETDTWPRVEQALERAASLNERSAYAHALLADVKVRLGRNDQALASAQRAVGLAPNETYTHLSLARAFWSLSRQDDAQRAARTAMSRADTDEERRGAQEMIAFLDKNAAAARQPVGTKQAQPAAAVPANQAAQPDPNALFAKCQAGDAAACSALLSIAEAQCNTGRMEACTVAGSLYTAGRGVVADQARAATLFDKACAGGMPISCVAYASMQAQGIGVARDDAKASATLERLCGEQVAEGCVEFALLLARKGTRPDLARARDVLTKSCGGGTARACEMLKSFPK